MLTFRLLYNECMSSITIPPEQWPKIIEFLRGCPDVYVGDEDRCKLFVEAVVWINRSGAQWRLLPAEYGKMRTDASCSSKPLCGSIVEAHSGDCFQPSTASGTPSTSVSPDGARGASGSECTSISSNSLTWNTS